MRSTGRCSCWPRRIRSSRKAPTRCRRRSSIGSCSTSSSATRRRRTSALILAQTTSADEPAASPVADRSGTSSARGCWSARSWPPTTWWTTPARLVRATRPGVAGLGGAPDFVRQWVRWGAGPRAGQSLLLAGKARAVLHGRPAVSLEDIRAVAPPVLRHRVLVNFQAEADGVDAEAVVARLLETVDRRRVTIVERVTYDRAEPMSRPHVATAGRTLVAARSGIRRAHDGRGPAAGPAPQPVPRLQRRVQPVPALPARRRSAIRGLEGVRADRPPLHAPVPRDDEPGGAVRARRQSRSMDYRGRGKVRAGAAPSPRCWGPWCWIRAMPRGCSRWRRGPPICRRGAAIAIFDLFLRQLADWRPLARRRLRPHWRRRGC